MARSLNASERNADFIAWGLRGDVELQKVMAELPDAVRRRVLRKVLKNNGQYVAYEMSDNAPVSRGYASRRRRAQGHAHLRDLMAVKVTTKASKRGGGTRVRIGAIYPDAAQAHLTNAGTAQRFAKGDRRIKGLGVLARIRANGLNRGDVTGTHWVEKSWRMVRDRFVDGVTEGTVQGVLNEGARLRRKHEKGGK